MSDTPRTDAKVQFFGFNPDEGEEFVTASFARELERDLELQLRINAELRTELEDYKWWYEAYLEVGDALGINEPALSGHGWFAECVLELKAENAKLRNAIDTARKEAKQ